jgi:hypothetical protein
MNDWIVHLKERLIPSLFSAIPLKLKPIWTWELKIKKITCFHGGMEP